MTAIGRALTLLGALVVGAGVGTAQVAAQDIHSGTHPAEAVIKQVIKGFDNPEAAIFSADGKFVFVANAAEIGSERSPDFGWAEGEGYISKLEVLPSGELKMVNDKLITGLTAPLGMGVLPVATAKFPRGTIFVCVGSAPLRAADGKVVTDPARLKTKVLAFNVDGKVLGEIATGPGTVFAEVTGSPIVLINALGFDRKGNLYVADTAFGGAQFEPPFMGKGGLWKIPVEAIDALAEGKRPATLPGFLSIPGNPDGVQVSPLDGMIYVNTVGPVAGAPDPANGGIYAVADVTGSLPSPMDSKLGALDGLDFTAGGTMLNTQIRGDIPARLYVTCPGKLSTTLMVVPGGSASEFNGPADIAVRWMPDGSHLVVVPELFARDATPGDDEITVLALPPNFDSACRQK